MEEIFDIYDGTGKQLGITKPKSEVHKNGFWHKSFHCWIIYKGNDGNDFIILQKRAANKKSWPNKLDISAAGHYTAGEGIEGGLREIKEELGVDISKEDLISLGVRVCIEEFDTKSINHEFQDLFFLIDDRALTDYKMSLEEVSGLVAIPVKEGIRLFAKEINNITATGYILDSEAVVQKQFFDITTEDFIPTLDNYYFKVMILAERALKGEKYLAI
jgi:isopentenyldiphosphate isomerase